MELRQNQIEPVRIGIEYFKQTKPEPSIIVAPTAFGKSICIAKIAESVQDNLLILQPSKELLEQNYEKYIRLGGYAEIYSASFNRKKIGQVTYATIGSIKSIGVRFKELGFTKMIMDECFVAGTLIDGVPIENIRVGDTVNSFNHEQNKVEKKRVVRLFKKEIESELIRFKLTNGTEFICTDNHPIFTKELGYIPAKVVYLCPRNYTLLYDKQNLPELSGHISSQMEPLENNFLQSKMPCCKYAENNKKNTFTLQGLRKKNDIDWNTTKKLFKNRLRLLFKKMFIPVSLWRNSAKKTFRPNEKKQPYVDERSKRKNDRIIQRANFFSKRRERTINQTPNDAALSNWLSNGISNRNCISKTPVSITPVLLQGRFSYVRKENSNRGGWENTPIEEMEVFGPTENGSIECVGVAGCEIYKRGNRKKFEQGIEKTFVYNFEVEDNNNYFANGVLVHNCHLYPREADSMLGRFLRESEIVHVLGLTATPLKLQTNTDMNRNAFSKLVMLTSRSKKGQFFKNIIYVSQVQEMVDLRFWCKLEYQQYVFDGRRLVFNSTKADYTEESLKAAYEANNMHGNVIKKIGEVADRKSIIVFVPSVAEACDLANQTPSAVAIYGNMPSKERAVAIAGFKQQRIRVIFNVNVLSVGFDHPELDCIICARPTASLAWFYQALGRGTRIAPTKKDCLIVDFSGNVAKFGKIEKLYLKKESIWKMYGEGGKLLTGIPLHEIGEHFEKPFIVNTNPDAVTMPYGKHQGKEIKDLPEGYRDWMLKEFTWNEKNKFIKDEILRIKNLIPFPETT